MCNSVEAVIAHAATRTRVLPIEDRFLQDVPVEAP